MTTLGRRIATVQALVVGCAGLASVSAQVVDEFEEVYRARLVRRRNRRWLLQVLHASRAADSAVGAFLGAGGITPVPNSLGPRLDKLAIPGVHGNRMPVSEVASYKKGFVAKRNRYVHEAGAYPTEVEAATQLADIDTCLSKTASLW